MTENVVSTLPPALFTRSVVSLVFPCCPRTMTLKLVLGLARAWSSNGGGTKAALASAGATNMHASANSTAADAFLEVRVQSNVQPPLSSRPWNGHRSGVHAES